ncbi:MAG: hypothetical protein ABIC95_01590 [archaeon]
MPGNYVVEDEDARDLPIEQHHDMRIRLDKAGYVLIKLDRKAKVIHLAFCEYDNRVKYRASSADPRDIIKTVLSRKIITSPEHAAYLGRELEKARIAMRLGFHYEQDTELKEKGRDKRPGPVLFYARRIPTDIEELLGKRRIRFDRLPFGSKTRDDILTISGQNEKSIMVDGMKVSVGWGTIRKHLNSKR